MFPCLVFQVVVEAGEHHQGTVYGQRRQVHRQRSNFAENASHPTAPSRPSTSRCPGGNDQCLLTTRHSVARCLCTCVCVCTRLSQTMEISLRCPVFPAHQNVSQDTRGFSTSSVHQAILHSSFLSVLLGFRVHCSWVVMAAAGRVSSDALADVRVYSLSGSFSSGTLRAHSPSRRVAQGEVLLVALACSSGHVDRKDVGVCVAVLQGVDTRRTPRRKV